MVDRLAKTTNSWIWLLTLFTLATFIEAVFWGQMGAFTPLYLPRLGVPQDQVATWTGLIASISGLVGIPFLPFWGALADRYARQPVIIRSFVVYLVAGTVAMLAGSVWVFLAARSVLNLSLGNTGLMMTTLSEQSPEERHGLVFSIMTSASPVGAFVGPLLGGPIVDRWSFPTLLLIDSLLMVVVILGLVFGYRDNFKGNKDRPLLAMAVDSVTIILRSPRLRVLFPALVLLFAGWMLAFTYVPLVVTSLADSSQPGSLVGLVVGAGGLVALVISPLIGALADRYGLWRMLFLSAILETMLWPLPALAGGIISFAVVWALLNGVASSVFALSFTVLARSSDSQVRGRVMSFSYLPVNIGVVIGPAVGSLVTRGSLFNVFPFAALLTACGILTLWYASRQKT